MPASQPAFEVKLHHIRMVLRQLNGEFTSHFDKLAVMRQVGKAQQCHARLSGSQELTRTSELKVTLGDFKTVLCFIHCPKSLARQHG